MVQSHHRKFTHPRVLFLSLATLNARVLLASDQFSSETLLAVPDTEAFVLFTGPDVARVIKLVQALRRATAKPIFLLAETITHFGRKAVLAAGADYCWSAPYTMAELSIRIGACLENGGKHSVQRGHRIVRLDGLVVEVATGHIELGEMPFVLSRAERTILLALCERAGEIVSYRELLERGWPTQHARKNHLVQARVRSLRAKLNGAGIDAARYILSVPGTGYRLSPGPAGLPGPAHPEWGSSRSR